MNDERPGGRNDTQAHMREVRAQLICTDVFAGCKPALSILLEPPSRRGAGGSGAFSRRPA